MDNNTYKIKRFVVSHRYGCELFTPCVFNTYDDACEYRDQELAEDVLNYIADRYDNEEYERIKDWEIADIIDYGEEKGIICGGNCFTGRSDWDEFNIDSVEIQLTEEELRQIALQMQKEQGMQPSELEPRSFYEDGYVADELVNVERE